MRSAFIATGAVMSLTQLISSARATAPTPDEMAESRRWVAARLEAGAAAEPAPPAPGLRVLANNDAVHKNARGGKPLRIAGVDYTRGLYCHAVSKVVVRLPGPGRTFTAVAGVDSNDQTSGGRGSVVFSVKVADREVFKSAVIHEGMAGVPVSVDLGGATGLTLEIGDAGDGISCDQADWADAKAVLADGSAVWLADLPFLEEQDPLSTEPPFSFQYDGKPSSEFLKTWDLKRAAAKIDDARTRHTLTWTDAQTGLVVRCEAIEYRDFPTVEWALHLKNTGAVDTPLLEKILPLDAGWQRGTAGEFVLHHNVGSPANAGDYGPRRSPLAPRATKRITAAGGRSTNSDLSYFNLEWPGEGRIVVVGWPGQWGADFVRDAGRGIRLRAGQEGVRFKLLPGEEVRTPLIVVQVWKGGDWIRAQNVWRRWMMAYGMPKPGGKLPPPQFCASSSRAYEEMIGANEANQILHVNRYVEEDLKLDVWWMDAGWYIQEKGWPQVGTWEIDPKRFPRGFKPISDHAHARGIKIIVWFEPERVAPDTWLAKTHPEWVHGGAKGGLLDLGNPEAWKWLVEHVDNIITGQGIDLYRQDFNMDPLSFWRKADAPDRQGITEIRHVTGLLAYWDELLKRHPGLLIDECASGGRRNDLECMRRAVPLWRSDYAFEATGHQGMTYGLSSWIPYHGTGTVACDNAPYYGGGRTPVQPYAFWSNTAPSLGSGIDIRIKEIDYAALRKLLAQWRQISPCYYGDFYPLTSYSLDNAHWIAWQLDRPEAGEGVVQAFRRGESVYEMARLRLRGLDPAARYAVSPVDDPGAVVEWAGRELLETGLPVTAKEKPSAVVLTYRRLQ